MIIIPKEMPQEKNYVDLDSVVTDGVYVVPTSEPKIYHLREAILMSKRLGRPLTSEEMANFEVKDYKED
ncbi:MAG: hypothetical protein J6Z11_14055 [Candidatus Riflebacteria bacterium]|nr:hypothetical protein [Candidatus Riflebacteria bacterium]